MAARKIKRPKKRRKPTPEEIEQRNHRKLIREVFRDTGFTKVLSVSDKEFSYNDVKSDFDDVFVYENIIVFAEYTTTQSSNISKHLKPKKIVYDEILKDQTQFIKFFEETFPSFKTTRNQYYDPPQCKIIILYCSRHNIASEHKKQVNNIKYLDYSILKYFKSVSNAVKKSARHELLHFLGLNHKDIGKNSTNPSESYDKYDGFLLPESHSNFDEGYKVVSFYMDPKSVLSRAYVLRKDGWRIEGTLYQRIISSSKIASIRKYLNENQRVFINNIIVTLPNATKLLDTEGNTIKPSTITKTKAVNIQIPRDFNTIGIIDGQHRVFSYHEGGKFEEKIEKLREKQNLLVTGIIYPDEVSNIDRIKFEATLFLEINKNQTNVRSDLTQAVGLLLKPFSSESIATSIINQLNDQGPLEDLFARNYFDKNKIKTASIVSYGLKPIVKLSGDDSFYSLWSNSDKQTLSDGKNADLLEEYIQYSVNQLNIFLSAIKENVDKDRWTSDRKAPRILLTATTINGFINCLRYLIQFKKIGEFSDYSHRLKRINEFDFNGYKSSQYRRMGEGLFNEFFGDGSPASERAQEKSGEG